LEEYRIFFLLGLTILDGAIITFFSISIKYLSNSEIFNEDIASFADKDYHRVQILVFYSFYFSIALLEFLSGLFIYFFYNPKDNRSY